jgi:hypothetical protein
MDSRDPHRAAKLLIDLHGDGARTHAAQRYSDMRLIEDEPGAAAWLLVLQAIGDLLGERPRGGEMVH